MSAKNQNHLIFNALITIHRPGQSSDELGAKTNELIDQLTLKTLKVCPDLIQRFLKVKQKQESNTNEVDNEWLIEFSQKIFDHQLISVQSMRVNIAGPSSFLRSLNAPMDDPKSFLVSLIIGTSLPLCFSFPKLLSTTKTAAPNTLNYTKILQLLISCLKCIKEWKECVDLALKEVDHTDLSKTQINENLRRAFRVNCDDTETLYGRLNLELLTKYLPKFEVFADSQQKSLLLTFDTFSLYFDVFMSKSQHEDEAENLLDDDLIGNCFNLLQIETLEKNLLKLVPDLLRIETRADGVSETDKGQIIAKYLTFLIKYLALRQGVESEHTTDLILRANENSYFLERKNLTLSNFVKIVFAHRVEFASLIGLYLSLIEAYLAEDNFEPIKNCAYMFLLLWKKHFFDDAPQDEFYADFIYSGLNCFLSYKLRNSMLFEMSLGSERVVDLWNVLFWILVRNYLTFRKSFLKNNLQSETSKLQTVEDFLFDFIFGLGLTLDNSADFSMLLENEFVVKEFDEMGKEFMQRLREKINERLSRLMNTKAMTGAEAFMIEFENCAQLKSLNAAQSLTTLALNLDMRFSHLLYLLRRLVRNVNSFFNLFFCWCLDLIISVSSLSIKNLNFMNLS